MDLDTKILKIVSKEFQIENKFRKSYPKSSRLDTSFENRIRLILDWIQIQNVESVSNGLGYKFRYLNLYPMDLNTSLKT